LLAFLEGLFDKGATIDNCLIIDDLPYKNIMNNPYSAVHPPCTKNSEKKLKSWWLPFFQQIMIPFLQELLASSFTIPE